MFFKVFSPASNDPLWLRSTNMRPVCWPRVGMAVANRRTVSRFFFINESFSVFKMLIYPCILSVYLKIDIGTSPVQTLGCFTLNRCRIMATVLTVLLGSVSLNPLRMPGPVMPHGTSISSVLIPPCPYPMPPGSERNRKWVSSYSPSFFSLSRYLPISSETAGGKFFFLISHPLSTMPCCSGPLPVRWLVQLGKVTEGITTRVSVDRAPSACKVSKWGVWALIYACVSF